MVKQEVQAEILPTIITSTTVSDPDYLVDQGEALIQTFGVDLSGVADLLLQVGFTTRCSGALLSSRQHVLTAAHCLSSGGGANLFTSGSASFNGLPPADNGTTIAISNATIHPDFTGSVANGFDIAILELAAEVTNPSIRAYDILTVPGNGVDLNVTSIRAGYGNRGTGSTGQNFGTSGTLRTGLNEHETTFQPFTSIIASLDPEGILIHDFDSGLSNNDAFEVFGVFNVNDLGFGDDEVNLAQGDSGGPTFVIQNGEPLISSVGSFGLRLSLQNGGGSDIDGALNFSFGEFGGSARVSRYSSFISSFLQVPEPRLLTVFPVITVVMLLIRNKSHRDEYININH